MTIHERCKIWIKAVIEANAGQSDEAVKDAEYIRDLLDKEEKYRWHDLRENPYDLPGEGELVVYAVMCLGKLKYAMTHHDGFYFHNWVYSNETGEGVIAWKYIEPFEKEKEK